MHIATDVGPTCALAHRQGCPSILCPAAYYTETLKYNKKYKLRVAGDSKSTDTAFCIGYKPDNK